MQRLLVKDEEFLEKVEQLKGELDPDDNGHFSFSGSASSKDGAKTREITLDSLNDAYDYIVDNNLDKDSAEYEELREDIRQFIEDNELDVVVKHSKKIQDLLEEVEEAMKDKAKTPTKTVEPEKSEEKNNPEDDSKKAEEEEVRSPRKRPSRSEDEEEAKSEEAAEERPKRRRRLSDEEE